jgi:hypothetical protein
VRRRSSWLAFQTRLAGRFFRWMGKAVEATQAGETVGWRGLDSSGWAGAFR